MQMAMDANVRIALFAKWPERGLVKTRLAATLGQDLALSAYQWLVQHQVEQLVASRLPWDVWITPAVAVTGVPQWLPQAHGFYAQSEGDLGRRLAAATTQTFQRGSRGILLIGADCPYLNATLLCEMADAVNGGSFALAPTEDGGYAAFGLPATACQIHEHCDLLPSVFSDMPWSTPRLFEATLKVLQQAGHTPRIWPQLLDCDEEADWQRICKDFALK
jgi:uncharacterized protein